MRIEKRAVTVALFCLLVSLFSLPAWGQFQFPLKALSPVTTPFGEQRVRVALEYNEGERLLFQQVDKERREFHLPVVDVALGVSPNVELLFCYPFLYMKQKGQDYNYGSGDLRIGGVFRFLGETEWLPTCAVKFAVKLPNADDTKEFGTDETDFFVGGVFEKAFGRIKLLLNTDFAILGNPTSGETKQDDVLAFRLGALTPLGDRFSAGVEFEGVEFSRYGNDRRFLRGGVATSLFGLLFDLSAAAGLTEASGDYQVSLGVTWKFGVEKRYPECPR